jgi:hypothetical protein
MAAFAGFLGVSAKYRQEVRALLRGCHSFEGQMIGAGILMTTAPANIRSLWKSPPTTPLRARKIKRNPPTRRIASAASAGSGLSRGLFPIRFKPRIDQRDDSIKRRMA